VLQKIWCGWWWILLCVVLLPENGCHSWIHPLATTPSQRREPGSWQPTQRLCGWRKERFSEIWLFIDASQGQ
jgi:hypothetical protein